MRAVQVSGFRHGLRFSLHERSGRPATGLVPAFAMERFGVDAAACCAVSDVIFYHRIGKIVAIPLPACRVHPNRQAWQGPPQVQRRRLV